MDSHPRLLSRILIPALLIMAFFFTALWRFLDAEPPPLDAVLEPIRAQYHLPALAGAIFTTDGVLESAAVGVRKAGTDIPVTTHDLWHLGSDTKAMTATLAATFVTEGKLSWDAKVASFFPEISDHIPVAMREITLDQILSHRAGLAENLNWRGRSQSGSLMTQRLTSSRFALVSPSFPPGSFHYSNTDYVVMGAILEKISGRSWEDLIQERIFQPLGMASAGFGGTGTLGQIDQPWPHLEDGMPAPRNGPDMDNPEIMGPAGTVHATMADWAKFLIDQLRGASGLPALLSGACYRALQTPAPGADYAYGWVVVQRPWAGGTALTHSGSNTMNYCVCWLAPAKKFGVLVCSNQGGDQVQKAGDDAASALIQRYLAKKY